VAVNIGDPAQSASWTPSMIEILNDDGSGSNTGSIGSAVVGAGTYSSVVAFQSINLTTSGYIFAGGSQGADAFVPINIKDDPTFPAASINPSIPSPPFSPIPRPTSPSVMFAAQNLTFAAGDGFVQEDTTGIQTTIGTGYYLTGVLTVDLYKSTAPKAIDLYGVFLNGASVITGPAAANTIKIEFGTGVEAILNQAAERALYRINSCVIGELGNCTPTGNPNLAIPLDQLSHIDLLSREDLDLEDPTVTGEPNEEIWRKPEKRR
jgi:hypothetical protein